MYSDRRPSRNLPTSYAEALAALKGKDYRKLCNNTVAVSVPRFHDEPHYIGIKLHNTVVVAFYPDGRVVLNSGGWETVTTKARINACLPAGWRVYSQGSRKGCRWGVYFYGKLVCDFADGDEVPFSEVAQRA